MHLGRRQNGRSLRRRLYAAGTLVAYLLACLGLPVPADAITKDAGQAFPCQEHGCGCRTAEQCWTHCCCFSPEQRWTWAQSHNVQPPAYAEKPATTSWRTGRKRDQAQNCCSENRPGPRSCRTCPETSTAPKSEHGKKDTPAKKNGFRWALGMSALGCQGQTTLWASTASVLPPAPPVTWAPWPTVVDRLAYADEIAISLSPLPPDPPPRSTQA